MRSNNTCPSPPLPPLLRCRCDRRAYLDSCARTLLPPSFSEWVQERRELRFLLSHLDFS